MTGMILRNFFIGFCFLTGSLAFYAQEKAGEESYPVRIILEARPEAKFYQVEWLERNDIEDQADAPANASKKEKITRTEIKRNLPVRFKYFRLRSAYRDGLFGPWGDIVEIQRPVKSAKNNNKPGKVNGADPETAAKNNTSTDAKGNKKHGVGAKPVTPQDVFAQVIDKNGREKWVLRGTSVPADRLDQNNPLFYDVECLTEKNAPENTNGRRKYDGPVPFTRPGQYKMNLYNTEDVAQAEPIQTWTFWVYTDVPRTYAKFYAPFLHSKGGFTVGGKTRIALLPQQSPVATDKTEYRVYPEGGAPGPWIKYEDEIEVSSFAKDRYGYFNVEFQTTNVAGNTEPPQLRRMLIDAHGPVIEEIPPGTTPDGAKSDQLQFSFKDENYPIVVRIYQGEKLIEDKYFKFWNAQDLVKVPAGQGIEIRAIDLLGNETILKK